jgi:hypothetical protein
MKLRVTLLVAFLGLTSQAFACPNPVGTAAVQHDINSLENLGNQYNIAGNGLEDAWRKETLAKQQEDVIALTLAKGQFMIYRMALDGIRKALINTEAKLNADLMTALASPCPADYTGR